MKRSTAIALMTMGAVGGVVIYANSEQEPSREAFIYRTVDDCILSGPISGADQQRCRAEYQAAIDEHRRTAPRFSTLEACQAEYGANACEFTPIDGANLFVPRPIGYVFGPPDAARAFTTQPLYPVTAAQRADACDGWNAAQCPPQPGSNAQGTSGSGTGSVSSSSGRSNSSTSVYWFSTSHGTVVSAPAGPSPSGYPVRVPASVASPAPSRAVNVVARNGFGQTGKSMSFAFHGSGG